MTDNKCPVCGSEFSLKEETKTFTAVYAGSRATVSIPVKVCSCCGAKFDDGKDADELRKKAMLAARSNSVSETLERLEKTTSFTDIERSFYLPPKTLSKWKNESKSPSASAAALVSLLGVFPWLSYVGMANFEPETAYKIAGAAFFAKATESEKIRAFYSSSNNYELLGLVKDNTITTHNEIPLPIENAYGIVQPTTSPQEAL